MKNPAPLTLFPGSPHTHSVIWLHGLGASAHDFDGIVPMLNLPTDHGIKFIFPNAPKRPVTLNGGYAMPAWYDITGLSLEAKDDREGLEASRLYIESLIQAEIEAGIDPANITLMGFSQGGAMSLYAGLRYPEKLAGIICLSGYLPLAKTLAAEKAAANQATPILMLHGTQDDVVPLAFAELTQHVLNEQGYGVELQTFPMAHELSLESIQVIGATLLQSIG